MTLTLIGSSTTWGRTDPSHELPFTGGFPDGFGEIPDAFTDGEIGKLQSIVPGSGPRGVKNDPAVVGDNPNLPRDPDKFDGDIDAQREFRQRTIPSGLAKEIFLDVYERRASLSLTKNLQRRLFDAYVAKSREWTQTATVLSPRLKAISTRRRTASTTTNVCSFRRRCSTAR